MRDHLLYTLTLEFYITWTHLPVLLTSPNHINASLNSDICIACQLGGRLPLSIRCFLIRRKRLKYHAFTITYCLLRLPEKQGPLLWREDQLFFLCYSSWLFCTQLLLLLLLLPISYLTSMQLHALQLSLWSETQWDQLLLPTQLSLGNSFACCSTIASWRWVLLV